MSAIEFRDESVAHFVQLQREADRLREHFVRDLVRVILRWDVPRDRISVASRPTIVPATDPLAATARSVSRDGLPLRLVVRDDWFALALFGEGTEMQYRYLVHNGARWMALGGGGAGGGPDRPLLFGVSASWSTPINNPHSYAAVSIEGTVAADVARVQIAFADGRTEDAVVHQRAYVWFYARKPAPPRSSRKPFAELFGAEPEAIVALRADGTEVARENLHPMR